MEWDRQLVDQLDVALNESQVCGLRFDADTAEARLLVQVLALPEAGPIDPDPRRVLVFSAVSSIEVILRADRGEALGPVVPLESLDALAGFFAGLGQIDTMYGWSFIDVQDVGDNWNVPASLSIVSSEQHTAAHTLHWFTECGRTDAEANGERFFLQGVIRFDDLRIERADARPVPVAEFVTDARRWWDALERRDPRLSSGAQQHAQTSAASWRSRGGTAQNNL